MLNIGDCKATEERDAKVREYISRLVSIQNKLARHNKYFFVYITPSKASYTQVNIPDKYWLQSEGGGKRISEVFRNELSNSNVNVFDSISCIPSDREWPLFYKTGIHWSRPIEQLSNIELVKRLAQLSGKNFHNNHICGLNISDTPFWRDADVYDLLNVCHKIPDTKFYEFAVEDDNMQENTIPYDELRILVQGGSYSEGIIMDHFSHYALDDRYLLFYNQLERQTDNSAKAIKDNDWNNIDLQFYLDNVDFVVIEVNEAAIPLFSNGFAEYLDSFLDNYRPMPRKIPRDYVFDPMRKIGLMDSRNFYGFEGDFSWCGKNSYVGLENANISQNGLNVRYVVPEEIFKFEPDIEVVLRINGCFMGKKRYNKFTQENIYISAEALPKNVGDVYKIELCCSKTFNPKIMGMSEDARDLALQVQYVGEAE